MLEQLTTHIRRQQDASVEFVQELAREHSAGQHVIPSYATCPGCILARERAKQRAGAA